MVDKLVEELFATAVDAYRKIPSDLPVGIAIEGITGFKVIPLDDSKEDRELVEKLCRAARELIKLSQEKPIRTSRVNELGNNIEEPLLNACNAVGLSATWPKSATGTGGRSGYPDIAIDIDGDRPTYLEAKVVGEGKEKSTFRSFYLSPSENPKVCVDARHLLLAFKHDRQLDASDGSERYRLTRFMLVDLSRVKGKIKFEYQSSNKDMYMGKAVIKCS